MLFLTRLKLARSNAAVRVGSPSPTENTLFPANTSIMPRLQKIWVWLEAGVEVWLEGSVGVAICLAVV